MDFDLTRKLDLPTPTFHLAHSNNMFSMVDELESAILNPAAMPH